MAAQLSLPTRRRTAVADITDEQIAAAVRPLYADDTAASMGLTDDIRTVRTVLALQPSASAEPATAAREQEGERKLINIALGLMDAPKNANLVSEVANLLRKLEEMQAKADDYDRLAEVARERRHRLEASATGAEPAIDGAISLAKFFHDTYEQLAPAYGYETRPETRQFNVHSKNGRLMVAVCRRVLRTLTTPTTSTTGKEEEAFDSLCREHDIFGTAAARQCEVFWRAGKRFAGKVDASRVRDEALEAAAKLVENYDTFGDPTQGWQDIFAERIRALKSAEPPS
jgi:hypothetical protein